MGSLNLIFNKGRGKNLAHTTRTYTHLALSVTSYVIMTRLNLVLVGHTDLALSASYGDKHV